MELVELGQQVVIDINTRFVDEGDWEKLILETHVNAFTSKAVEGGVR